MGLGGGGVGVVMEAGWGWGFTGGGAARGLEDNCWEYAFVNKVKLL